MSKNTITSQFSFRILHLKVAINLILRKSVVTVNLNPFINVFVNVNAILCRLLSKPAQKGWNQNVGYVVQILGKPEGNGSNPQNNVKVLYANGKICFLKQIE